MESLLLHSCCGPCSTAVIERLLEDYNITVFFYNPNITEAEEYALRLDAQKTVIEKRRRQIYYRQDRTCRGRIQTRYVSVRRQRS